MAARLTQSALKLAASLSRVQTGPSSRPLPSDFKSLTIRYHGLKGNAGAKHWAKESLPALLFANPSIPIVVEPAVVKRPSRNKGKGKEVDTSETEEAVVVVKDSWKVAPGVTIAFHSTKDTAFFPLTPTRSEELVKRFWKTIDDPIALEALKSTGPVA